jgi:hypothetical protein
MAHSESNGLQYQDGPHTGINRQGFNKYAQDIKKNIV